MDLQVLVATMNQDNHKIIEEMNLQSDAIIVNQCNKNLIEEIKFNNNNIKFISLQEKGVGLSRNTALMRATADICLFADDDVTYVDGYKEIIANSFKKNPRADIILFNVPSSNPSRPTYMISKSSRVRWFNCLRYGAVKIAIRTQKIHEKNICFSLLFGGGAPYSAGEDSLFIADCIRSGLTVYTDPNIIGYVAQQDSSWFKGYTNKYFFDKGVFYACLSKRWAKLLVFQFVLRHRKVFKAEKTCKEALDLMLQGVKEFSK